MKRFYLIYLFSFLLPSCNKDPYYCLEVDEKKTNSDCTCKIKENEYEIIDNIDGIDSYTRCRVEYNYPIDGETHLDYLEYYSKKEETNEEIAQLGIQLVKYVFNSDKYDFIHIPRNGGGLCPYYFYVEYNNTKNENVGMCLEIGDLLSLELYTPGCIKSNKHLYLHPGIYAESMDEDTINDIKKFIELIKEYLEDKEAELITPF